MRRTPPATQNPQHSSLHHPFIDGNKRTALATCLVFLSGNGLLPDEKLEADAWEKLTLDVAASRLDRGQTSIRVKKLLGNRRV
jgi:death-on-curing protein